MAFGSFSSLFIALCSSSDVAVYLTSEFLGFASCLHSLGIHLPRLYMITDFGIHESSAKAFLIKTLEFISSVNLSI